MEASITANTIANIIANMIAKNILGDFGAYAASPAVLGMWGHKMMILAILEATSIHSTSGAHSNAKQAARSRWANATTNPEGPSTQYEFSGPKYHTLHGFWDQILERSFRTTTWTPTVCGGSQLCSPSGSPKY